MPRRTRLSTLLLSLALALTGATTAVAAPADTCREVRVPVRLAAGADADQTIFGRLCQPGGGAARVQLLVHGATYDNTYWDLPGRNSYVGAALAAGDATFAIDRIGVGRSSRPPGLSVTVDTNAFTVAQVADALRAGTAGLPAFGKVVLVGHSLGTFTSWLTASRYHNVDGVVFTGALHPLHLTGVVNLLPRVLNPAPLDPVIGGKNSDPTHLTTFPGHRNQAFHLPGIVSPELLALDEQTKATVSAGEVATFPAALLEPKDVRVPVFLVIGARDTVFCGLLASDCADAASVATEEAKRLGAQVPSVAAYSLPGAGHCVNHAANAADYYAATQRWIASRIR